MGVDALKLSQLRYYVAAIEAGSFVAAGERLHITKTSISHGVSSLEALLGTQLVVRKRAGGVKPTPSGQKFLVICRSFLLEAESILEEFQSRPNNIRGQLVVGCQEAISWAVAPRVINELNALHPDLSISVKAIEVDQLLSPLEEGQVDMLVNFHYENSLSDFDLKFDPKDYYTQVLCRPKAYAMMSLDHPLCKNGRTKVYLKDLAPYPHNFIQEGSALTYFGQVYKKAGLTPNVDLANNSSLGAQSTVGKSNAVSLRFVRPSINFSPIGDPLAFLEIADEIDQPQIIAIARKNSQGNVSMRAEAFIDICQRKFDDGTLKENLFYA